VGFCSPSNWSLVTTDIQDDRPVVNVLSVFGLALSDVVAVTLLAISEAVHLLLHLCYVSAAATLPPFDFQREVLPGSAAATALLALNTTRIASAERRLIWANACRTLPDDINGWLFHRGFLAGFGSR
jgi:hypothetical protein